MAQRAATGHRLALAVNGREHQLSRRLPVITGADGDDSAEAIGSVVVVGLGYVGLPTAFALRSDSARTIGFDISEERLGAIKAGDVDLTQADREGLAAALADGTLELSSDPSVLSEADAVIICVPTPVDDERAPDLRALRDACKGVVTHARPGQTIILTSTTFVGTTRRLLVEPLQQKGLQAGTNICVAFSPERIDPGNHDHVQRETPRVVGGSTPDCGHMAARIIRRMTDAVYLVDSPEAAELCKLYENIFRAVNLALANEIADVCAGLDLDPVEVTIAAGTKPYGFLGSFPGPGVGGHCIPCDPHYLLWQLREHQVRTPIIEQAMRAIEARPGRVVQRVVDLLDEQGISPSGARVLVAGVSYKSGVKDLRESPALPIIAGLRRHGAEVHYHDPLIPRIELRDGTVLHSEREPRGEDWDVTLIHTVHPGFDYGWARNCRLVVDATYQFDSAPHRHLL